MKIVNTHPFNVRSIIMVAVAVALLGASVFALVGGLQRNSYAATVPDSCFTFDSGTGTIQDYNLVPDVACLDDVTIPATIGGVPVTTIASLSFQNASLNSVVFPASVTLIKAGAFASTSLNSITIASSGNLTIESGAFSVFLGTDLSIGADGAVTIGSIISSTPNLVNLSLEAGGNLLTDQGAFGGVQLDSLSMTSGGTLVVQGGSFGGIAVEDSLTMSGALGVTTQAGSLNGIQVNGTILIESDQNIALTQGSMVFSGGVATTVSIRAGGSFSTSGSAFGGIDAATLSIDAVQDIIIGANTMTGLAVGAIQLSADRNITITSSLGGAADSVMIAAGGGLSVTNGSGGISALNGSDVDLSLESGTGLMVVSQSSFSSIEAAAVTITAPAGLSLLSGAFNGAPLLSQLDISSEGDITIEGGVFNGTLITDLSLETDGNVVLGVYGLELLERLSVVTAGDITVANYAFVDALLLTTAIFNAGGTLTLGEGIMEETSLTSLALASTGAMSIGAYSFNSNQLTTLTLPASLTSIGDGSFNMTNLDTVYIAGSPTIGSNVFRLSGYDGLDLGLVKYTQLYTADPSNPAGYIDTVFIEDVNGDTVDDNAGGYIVNPASYSFRYTSRGQIIAPSDGLAVGKLADGTLLTSYLVAANNEGLGVYFRPGQVLNFDAPSIAGYITPEPVRLTLGADLNLVNFMYAAITIGVPSTGLKSNNFIAFAVAAALGAIALVAGAMGVHRISKRRD